MNLIRNILHVSASYKRTSWSEEEINSFKEEFGHKIQAHRKVDVDYIKSAFDRFPCLKHRGEKKIRARVSSILNGQIYL